MGTKVTPSNETHFGAPDLHIYNAKKKHVRGNSKLDPVGPPQKSLHLEDLNVSGSQQTQMLKQLFKNNPTTQRNAPVAQSLNLKKG